MSVTEKIRKHIQNIGKAEPFTSRRFLDLGSRAAVDKALSRLVAQEVIQRIKRGVFMRPKQNKYIGMVMPGAYSVVKAISRESGEKIHIHGANAVLGFSLSTQMPMIPIFYTSGPSRKFMIGKLPVKLMHVSNRKLQLAGSKAGMALSALWYMGRDEVNAEVIDTISKALSAEDFESLKKADIPAWMSNALHRHSRLVANVC
ncbi:MAG: DUF6088 family protein [Candidatus Porifericomitaceae bacterium WSBS_2022_MAG_OTU9]